MSGVMCQVSPAFLFLFFFLFFSLFLDKMVELVRGGSVINMAYRLVYLEARLDRQSNLKNKGLFFSHCAMFYSCLASDYVSQCNG